MRWILALAGALVLGLGGCREQLTVPGQCPDQCPGGAITIRDIVVEALPGGDSTFVGYVGFHDAPGLLLTNDSAVGIAHAIVAFDSLPETIPYAGQEIEYQIDSVIVTFGVTTRDTLVKAPRLLVYRIPPGLDSTLGFTDLDNLLQGLEPIDTMVVPDSVITGDVFKVYRGEELEKLAVPPEDNRYLALAVRLVADTATGIRLGSRLTQGFAPGLAVYTKVNVTDDSTEVLFYSLGVRYAGSTRQAERLLDPDLLTVGGLPAARSVIRFELPEEVMQASSLLRATLELAPARPFTGLFSDPTLMDVRAVVVDLGFKSVPIGTSASSVALPISGDGPFTVEVGGLVNIWRLEPLVPQMLYLSIDPEGQAFGEPVFHSTRSATGRPRLRITYTTPAPLEAP